MWATVILEGPCQREGNKNIHVSIYKHTMNAAIVKNFPLQQQIIAFENILCYLTYISCFWNSVQIYWIPRSLYKK